MNIKKLKKWWQDDTGASETATTVVRVVLGLAIASGIYALLGTAFTAKAKQEAFYLRCTDPSFSNPNCP